MTVIHPPLSPAGRPAHWAAWIASGTVVPPPRCRGRDQIVPRRWAGRFVLAAILLLIAVPMVLQVTR